MKKLFVVVPSLLMEYAVGFLIWQLPDSVGKWIIFTAFSVGAVIIDIVEIFSRL